MRYPTCIFQYCQRPMSGTTYARWLVVCVTAVLCCVIFSDDPLPLRNVRGDPEWDNTPAMKEDHGSSTNAIHSISAEISDDFSKNRGWHQESIWEDDPRKLAMIHGLPVNQTAPDFVLNDTDGATSVRLSDLRGRPVALAFGSFTCEWFTAFIRPLVALSKLYHGRVHFLIVYGREQHPSDGRSFGGPDVAQAATYEERRATTVRFREYVGGVAFPVLVDIMGRESYASVYRATPNRLYILNAEGVVAPSILDGLLGETNI